MEKTQGRCNTRPVGRRSGELKVALLGLLGFSGLVPPAAQSVTCLSGAVSPEPVPVVSFLRGYWASLQGPTGLAVDRAGAVYVTDARTGTITVRAADGSRKQYSRRLGKPISVGISPNDSEPIFVGDGASGTVTAYSRQFDQLFELGSGNGEFQIPADIAVDPTTGNIWVVDSGANTVAVFEPNGARISTLAGGPGAPFGSPTGIAIDALGGEVIVADQLNSRLQLFDLDGVWRRCLGRQGSSPGRFGSPRGIAVDALGRIYISDVFQGRIQVIDRNGRHIAYVGEFGDRPGAFAGPADMVVDPFGRLFVATTNSGRLDLFGLDTFEDPEAYLPGEIAVKPNILTPKSSRMVNVSIRLPGHQITAENPTNVRVNGLAASRWTIADEDGDGDMELILSFSLSTLLGTFPGDGEWPVKVEGEYGALKLVGESRVTVVVGGRGRSAARGLAAPETGR